MGPRQRRNTATAAAGALAALALLAGATSARASSAARASLSGAGPILQVAPSVIGTTAVGKLLTGLSGTWGGTGVITYSFQWYRCNAAGAACGSIRGATSPTFALGARDVGKTLGLTVRAQDVDGTTSAFASLVGPVAPTRALLESTAQPVITGPPIEGKTVQVTTGTWSPVPASLTYRWARCNPNGRACAQIPRAIDSSYTPSNADLGHALVAIVQATNGSTVQNAFSTATPAIVDGSVRGPRLLLAPVLAGEAVVGQQLVATPGVWRGVGPIAFVYRWYRCDETGGHCALIPTGNQASYTTGARDIGGTIGLTLRVSDGTGAISAYTSLLGPIAAADAPLTATSPPTITGTARVGGTLTAAKGTWAPAPAAFTYTWLRCNANGRLCAPILGAAKPAYRPTRDDQGHALVASVIASSGGSSQAALTAATAPIS